MADTIPFGATQPSAPDTIPFGSGASNQTSMSNSSPSDSIWQNLISGAGNFAIGVGKGIGSTIKTTSDIAAAGLPGAIAGPLAPVITHAIPQIQNTINTTKDNIQSTVGLTDQNLQPTTPAQQAGKLTEQAGEILAPFGFGAKAALDAGLAGKALLGKEGIATLGQIANPEAKAFVPVAQGGGGKTFSSVVQGTQDAINSFISKSKAALQAVKQEIPTNVNIDPNRIEATVNQGILRSVQSNAAYHGINGEVSSIFKTPESLINSGLLNADEVGRVKGMVDVINNWTDHSARGVLNLKEQLAPFYKDGLNGSNNILSNIQNGLKNLVSDVHPAIKPALETASNNIDKANEFSKHLVGTNPATGESKLITLAKSLDNPALKGYQHSLLVDLKNATGHDVLPQLQGYADYLKLHAKDFPSKVGTILKSAATGPITKVVGGVVGAGLANKGLKATTGIGL